MEEGWTRERGRIIGGVFLGRIIVFDLGIFGVFIGFRVVIV